MLVCQLLGVVGQDRSLAPSLREFGSVGKSRSFSSSSVACQQPANSIGIRIPHSSIELGDALR